MSQKLHNIPVSMDSDFLAEIDSLASALGDSRSGIMRRAIRAGLPLVKAGGNADVITLDSELSADVNEAAKEKGANRNKSLIEAIRLGLEAHNFQERLDDIRDLHELGQDAGELFLSLFDGFQPRPLWSEIRRTFFERARLRQQIDDILAHVPEAHERVKAIDMYARLHRSPFPHEKWTSQMSTKEIVQESAKLMTQLTSGGAEPQPAAAPPAASPPPASVDEAQPAAAPKPVAVPKPGPKKRKKP